MKVTIELDSVTDKDMLDEVLRVLPNGISVRHVTSGRIEAADSAMTDPIAEKDAATSMPSTSPFVPPPSDMFGPPAAPTQYPPFPPTIAPSDRDSEGLPWDGRIHSSSKALLADGKWRQRRNTDPAVVAAVTAELRAAMVAPSAPVPAAPPSPPAPPVLPPAAVVPPPPPVEPAPAAMTFPQFMHAITAARLAPGVVLEACKAVGMPSIPALAQRTDLIPAVATALWVAS